MALAIDGTAHNSGSGSTLTLTTTNASDVVAVFVNSVGSVLRTVSSISSTHTTGWTKRKQLTYNTTDNCELWYGKTTAVLSSEVITVTMSGSSSVELDLIACGISGANTSSITDSNASLPASATGTTGTASVGSVSTSNANDMLIAVTGSATTTSPGVPSGFTAIFTDNTGGSAQNSAARNIVSTTQSRITVTWVNSSAPWGAIVDAVQAAPTTLPQPIFDLPAQRLLVAENLKTWTWSYNLNLIGKDFMPAAFRKEHYDRPPYYDNLEATGYRRSWEWSYNKNLIAQDKMTAAFRKEIYELPPISTEPNPRRSWEWWYNLNLIGQDKLPFFNRDWPVPVPTRNVYKPPTFIFYYVQAVMPFFQTDWPNPKDYPRLVNYTWLQSPAVPPVFPFNQFYWPLTSAYPPAGLTWTSPAIQTVPSPFAQLDWPLSSQWKTYPYKPPTFIFYYVQSVLPFSQYDWPLGRDFQRLPDYFWSQSPAVPPFVQAPLPFNQYDWPNPRDYLRLTYYTWLQSPLVPVVVLPFNEYDWPLPKTSAPIDQTWLLNLSLIPGAPVIVVTDLHFKPHLVTMGRMGYLGGLS